MDTKLEKTLKSAIRASGLSHYRIGTDTGVCPRSIDRFMNGTTTLRLDIGGKIAAYLNLELVERKG